MEKKIGNIIDMIWRECWVKIYYDRGLNIETVWEGYASDLPDEYEETEFSCLVPMDDYGPVLGIELEEE